MWQEPFTGWNETVIPTPSDFNRFEGNIKHLKSEPGTFDGDKNFTGDIDIDGELVVGGALAVGGSLAVTGAITCTSLNTGHGNNELYPMNQAVRTTDNVTFATVNTGLGDNELYPMNQALRTTDIVRFAALDTGHGNNELYPMDQAVRTTDSVIHEDVTANGSFLPNTNATSHIIGVAPGHTYLFPRGIFMVTMTPASGFQLQIFVSGGWVSVAPNSAVFSSGDNVRFSNIASTVQEARVLKF